MSSLVRIFSFLNLAFFISLPSDAQKFSYEKQKAYIPIELGQVYLGIPFKNFAKLIDLKKADASADYGWLALSIPFKKGNVTEVFVKAHGIEDAEKETFLSEEKIMRKSEFDESEFETVVNRVKIEKIPSKTFIYQLDIVFKKGFDLENYTIKKYGKSSDVYKAGDDYHIYDTQWIKKTADGLKWIIRYHKSSNALQLIGVIDGTEWDPNS